MELVVLQQILVLLLSTTASEFNENDDPNISNDLITIPYRYCGNTDRYKTIFNSSCLLHLLSPRIYVYALIPSKINITATTMSILLKTNKNSSITTNSYNIRTMLLKNREFDYSMHYTLCYRNSKTKVILGFGNTISISSPIAIMFSFFFLSFFKHIISYSFWNRFISRDKPHNSGTSL